MAAKAAPRIKCPVTGKMIRPEDIQRNDGKCPYCGQFHFEESDYHGAAPLEVHPNALVKPPTEELRAMAESVARAALGTGLPTANPFKVSKSGILLLHGKPVKQEPVPFHSSQGWIANGAPCIGVIEHFQAGCGDPFGAFMDRQVSAHLSTQRGDVFPVPMIQFVSLLLIAFHAFSAAFHFVGIEAAVLPGVCDWTPAMVDTQAAVTAAIFNWAEATFGVKIPSRRSPGAAFRPGIKVHADGMDPKATWDPNRHWDSIFDATGDPIAAWIDANERAALDRSPMTAAQFCDRVAYWRDDVPLSKNQQAIIDLFEQAGTKAIGQVIEAAQNGDLDWLTRTHNGAKAAANGQKAPKSGTAERLGYDVKKAQLAGTL
jgi:hypothetical protein